MDPTGYFFRPVPLVCCPSIALPRPVTPGDTPGALRLQWVERAGFGSRTRDQPGPSPALEGKAECGTAGRSRILPDNLLQTTHIASTGSGGSLQPALFRWERRIYNMGPKRDKEHGNGEGKQKVPAPLPPSELVNLSYFPFYSFSFKEAGEVTRALCHFACPVAGCWGDADAKSQTLPSRLLFESPEATWQPGALHVSRTTRHFSPRYLRAIW